ncbi:MAG: hypothetical protein RLZZ628_3666 [Bacteroidota bacterium]|jgi:hypothetical protein
MMNDESILQRYMFLACIELLRGESPFQKERKS